MPSRFRRSWITRGCIRTIRSSSDERNKREAWLRRMIVGLHMDTSGALDHHRTALMKATHGLLSAGDGDQTAAMNRGSRSRLDRGPIVVRSWLIHCAIRATITSN